MPRAEPFLDLPLSWTRLSIAAPVLRRQRLPLSRRTWVPCADLPQDYSFQHLFDTQLRFLPGGMLLQGCNELIARFVLRRGGQVAAVGVEAVLPLGVEEKTSVQTLARRGRRWGFVQSIAHTAVNQQKMQDLWRASAHGMQPRLRCAFRSDFDASVRGFVMVQQDGRWLGAMTLSQMKPGYWHTELLLRRKDAPIGVMEALLLHVRTQLWQENQQWLSLGTAPFLHQRDRLTPRDWHSRLIMRMGHLLRFGYDYYGLYQFKQKFQPVWHPLYLCGWPNVPWRALPDLSWASRHLHLMGRAMFSFPKNNGRSR